MSRIDFHDISQWQGSYNMAADPSPIIMMKMSGGDAGNYYDSKASVNYINAKSAGKAVGMYHFAGGKNAIAEADFFVKACSPLEKADVLCLDWEVSHPDPVGWCTQFVNRVHELTSVWPLVYMNLSTLRAHDWNPVLNNCGLWVAAWGVNPDNNLNTGRVYVAHQFQGSPLDTSAWFGTVDQFKKYGYQPATQPPPVVVAPPVVTVPPVVVPQPEPIPPTPTPPEVPSVQEAPSVIAPIIETPPAVRGTLLDFIKSIVTKVIGWLGSWKR